MTQVIAAIQEEGIAVATDGRASSLSRNQEARRLKVQKLFPLGSHAFVLSAGMGLGIHLSRLFQAFVQQRGFARADDILTVAAPFFSAHYGEILSSGAFGLRNDQLDRILLLIGVTESGAPEGTHRMILLASESGRLPFEQHGISSCITMPRSMGTEYQLQSMCSKQGSLEEILAYARRFLVKRANESDDVGPPYYWGLLTSEGLTLGRWAEEDTD